MVAWDYPLWHIPLNHHKPHHLLWGDWSQTQGAWKTSRCFEGGTPGKQGIFWGHNQLCMYTWFKYMSLHAQECWLKLNMHKFDKFRQAIQQQTHIKPWRLLEWRHLEPGWFVCMSTQHNFRGLKIAVLNMLERRWSSSPEICCVG